MSDKIIFKISVNQDASAYYGELNITSIRHEDGSPLKVRNTLDIAFKSPAQISTTDFRAKSSPWIDFTPAITNTQIDSSTFDVVVKASIPQAYTINDSLKICFGVNGDLTQDTQRYTESIVITQDAD